MPLYLEYSKHIIEIEIHELQDISGAVAAHCSVASVRPLHVCSSTSRERWSVLQIVMQGSGQVIHSSYRKIIETYDSNGDGVC